MRLIVGSDHLGYRLKEALREHLTTAGHEVLDFGCGAADEIDYPDVAVAVGQAVAAGLADRAVLVCGTGIGMAIAANKVPGIRAASVADPYSAERASASNDARVLCLGSQVVGHAVAPMLVDRWLATSFAAGRSARKVAKIDAFETVADRK